MDNGKCPAKRPPAHDRNGRTTTSRRPRLNSIESDVAKPHQVKPNHLGSLL